MNVTPAPAFRLVSGNRLEDLAEHLGMRLRLVPDAAALLPETILIPQPTVRRWLQAELARRFGIAANLEFLTPSEFVWRLLRADRPDLPEASPWDQDRLRWRLFRYLNRETETLPEAVIEHLRRAADTPLTRWRLAEALAKAFDRYQAYRHDWLSDWERQVEPEDWQARVWQAMRHDPVPPRSQLIADWLLRYHDGGTPPPGLPARINAFGTINISPYVLAVFAAVARYRELRFYRPSPCAEYWGDVENWREARWQDETQTFSKSLEQSQWDNPLLKAWGRAGRDFIAQLFSYEIAQPTSEEERFRAPLRDTLLHTLQADVLERVAPRPLMPIAPEDASIQVHACHSRLREIEILHDRLRRLFDDDPSLVPEDVAVLAPDIGEYLSLVRAVFGGFARSDPRYIPYTLSDQPQAQAHPLIHVFLMLLELPYARRTVSEVLDLLSVPAVAAGLDLQDNDLQRLSRWLDASGIHWGDDETTRERLGLGRWREYSFAFGLDRLLLGYATGDTPNLLHDVAPFAELEGADSDRLDKLLSVLRRLRHLGQWQRSPHTAHEWQTTLMQQFLALLPAIAQDDAESQARRAVLEALNTFADQAADAGLLPIDVVATALRELLNAPSPYQSFLGGGVTFAGMVPLRIVPFRVICLLGLEAEAYPRQEHGGEINRLVDELQGTQRRLSDRSTREDDQFLFLQLLTAARDVFYVSYLGRDARDDEWREPSSVVAELLDVAQLYFPQEEGGESAWKRLVVMHPLQPFSSQAFGAGDTRRFSYRHEWWQPQAALAVSPEAPFIPTVTQAMPPPMLEPLPLHRLQAFLRNPAKAYLRDRLGIQLPEQGLDAEDSEPLGNDRLVRFQLTRHLLEKDDDDHVLQARGWLPAGRDGAKMAHDIRQIVDALRTQAADWIRTSGRSVECVEVDGIVAGVVLDAGLMPPFVDAAPFQGLAARAGRCVFRNPHAVLLPGRDRGKHVLPALLDHLLLSAQLGEQAYSALFWHVNDKIETSPLPVLTRAQAVDWLTALIRLYYDGQRRLLPFAPDAAYAYACSWASNQDPGIAWKAAVAAFDAYRGFGDGNDPWFRLAFRPGGLLGEADSTWATEFRALSRQVFLGPEAAS